MFIGKLFKKVRKKVHNFPSLHKLYFVLTFRYKKLEMFSDSKTDLHISGYPRSANTFLTYILMNVNSNIKTSSHLHTISNLKLSLKYNNNIVVLIRDPLDCISSHIIYRETENRRLNVVDIAIDDYIDFYNFVYKNKDNKNMIIINFDYLTNNLFNSVKYINETYNLNMKFDKTMIKQIEEQYLNDREDKRSKKLHNTPNDMKVKLKNKYKDKVRYQNNYKEAKKIYNKLKNHTIGK